MFTRDTYTEFKRVSSATSDAYIDLGGGYDGIIVTATTSGVVSAYGLDPQQTALTRASYSGDDNTIEFPATLPVGTYKIHVGAFKCASAADAVKFIVFR